MTDQPTPTPRTDAAEIDFSCETLTIHTRYVRADFARELERELAACVPGMELIARMLSDERALADRLAHWLASLEVEDLVPAEWSTSVVNAIRSWKEARRAQD